jgi:putative FmdB family regulatory protein
MPIYEYRCDRCDRTFETMQKFSDEPLHVHEGCGGAVERLISASAFQFKGTGWYVTDYGRKNAAPPANGKSESKDAASAGESKAAPAKSGTDSAKSETKPDAKAK